MARKTDREKRIGRALEHALKDPEIVSAAQLAKFIDEYLTRSEKVKSKSSACLQLPSEPPSEPQGS